MLKSYKRIICLITALLMILSMAFVMSGARALAAASGDHPLKDLPVFSSTRYDQWAGAGSPLSIETVPYNGNPALCRASRSNSIKQALFAYATRIGKRTQSSFRGAAAQMCKVVVGRETSCICSASVCSRGFPQLEQ